VLFYKVLQREIFLMGLDTRWDKFAERGEDWFPNNLKDFQHHQ
jgi:hypothetical protein